MLSELHAYAAGGGRVLAPTDQRWELSVPAGPANRYRLAQLDDYAHRPSRAEFPHGTPSRLQLRAQVSDPTAPGTWGFGFWNDPFGSTLTVRGSGRRWPALPQAAWFFFASPPNHLAFRDDQPAQGLLAATFRSLPVPLPVLLLAAPLAPTLLVRPAARLLRRLVRRFIAEDAQRLDLDPTGWHGYDLEWRPERVAFRVDGETVFETDVSPLGPLGLVLWVDNQYAAFPPDGRVRFGSLAAEDPVRLSLAHLRMET